MLYLLSVKNTDGTAQELNIVRLSLLGNIVHMPVELNSSSSYLPQDICCMFNVECSDEQLLNLYLRKLDR